MKANVIRYKEIQVKTTFSKQCTVEQTNMLDETLVLVYLLYQQVYLHN